MTFEPREVARALAEVRCTYDANGRRLMTESQLVQSIRRNWQFRCCDEARQTIRWRLWELRQLRSH